MQVLFTYCASMQAAVRHLQTTAPCEACTQLPKEFQCPLTACIMEQPVVAADGHTCGPHFRCSCLSASGRVQWKCCLENWPPSCGLYTAGSARLTHLVLMQMSAQQYAAG